MNDEERRRILQLVADGKITAEEAADLLDALQPVRRDRPAAEPTPERPAPRSDRPARALVIQISEHGSTKVNLRIPIGLARAAGKFIPRRAQQHLGEHGVDLEDVLGGLAGGQQGTLLQIEDDEDTVLIAVE